MTLATPPQDSEWGRQHIGKHAYRPNRDEARAQQNITPAQPLQAVRKDAPEAKDEQQRIAESEQTIATFTIVVGIATGASVLVGIGYAVFTWLQWDRYADTPTYWLNRNALTSLSSR
jgi:hypothetical protein